MARCSGFGEPVKVKQGERVMLHVLNSSPTEVHWVSLAGHSFQVVALDGNAVPQPRTVEMLRLAPAERVSAIVEMNAPGVWVLGEVRKHVQAAGMGIVVEYAGVGRARRSGFSRRSWCGTTRSCLRPRPCNWRRSDAVSDIPLAIDSKFEGHGNEERWTIKRQIVSGHRIAGRCKRAARYRLVMNNMSANDHPVHLHRHTFEVVRVGDGPDLRGRGLMKDVLLIPRESYFNCEFTCR